MRQLIEDLISAMEYHVEQTRPIHSTTVALQAAREALRAQPAPVHGPSLTDLAGAIEYADARWSGVDVPIEWARHFADAIGKLYTTPPAAQRPWVGLTDEETAWCTAHRHLIEWAEAKLKEKNT
jgi:hypothetical protein